MKILSMCIYILTTKKYLIKASATNVIIKSDLSEFTVFLKRVQTIPPPNYKKMLLLEMFGILAILFVKPFIYTLDISVEYSLKVEKDDRVILKISRLSKNANIDMEYDSISISSPSKQLFVKNFYVENREEIIQVYKKVRKTAHIWFYIFLEILFTLVGIAVAYPLLLFIYLSTKLLIFKILLYIVPFLIIGFVALVGILPMNLLFKYQDQRFYQAMEVREISSKYNE